MWTSNAHKNVIWLSGRDFIFGKVNLVKLINNLVLNFQIFDPTNKIVLTFIKKKTKKIKNVRKQLKIILKCYADINIQ